MEEVPVSRRTYRYLVLPGNEPSLVTEALSRRCWWEPTDDATYDFWWGGNGQRFPFEVLKRRRKGMLVFNKIENHREVCTKTGLARTVRDCAQLSGGFDWAPETHTFSRQDSWNEEMNKLKRSFQMHEKRATSPTTGRVWILKPAAMNRGKGIQIFDSMKSIESFLRSHIIKESYIVQKYIETPLLIDGRKFDIRVYVLVTSEPKVYLHEGGYIRTCSVSYNRDDVRALDSHLTNDAVQKNSSAYGAHEDCNKLTFLRPQLNFEEFEKAIRGQDPALGGFDFRRDVFSQIRECTRRLFQVAMRRMNPQKIRGSFELFGLDFMVDDKLRVFLVECNTSPALFRKGSHLKALLPRVIEEVVQKALDPHFPPPEDASCPEKLSAFEELETSR